VRVRLLATRRVVVLAGRVVMQQLMRSAHIYYVRYVDDFLILAQSRRVFRRAIKCVYQVMRHLQLRLHAQKRFIGKSLPWF